MWVPGDQLRSDVEALGGYLEPSNLRHRDPGGQPLRRLQQDQAEGGGLDGPRGARGGLQGRRGQPVGLGRDGLLWL